METMAVYLSGALKTLSKIEGGHCKFEKPDMGGLA